MGRLCVVAPGFFLRFSLKWYHFFLSVGGTGRSGGTAIEEPSEPAVAVGLESIAANGVAP
jgi:hypothetical protein